MNGDVNQFLILEISQSIIGISWAIMGMIFIIAKGQKAQGVKRYSLFLIVTLTLPMIQFLLKSCFPNVRIIAILESHSMPFLYGPCLYLYIKKILNEPLRGFGKTFIHFLPFLLFFILEFVVKSWSQRALGVTGYIYLHSASGASSVLLYGLIVRKKIKRYRKTIDFHFSSHESEITLSWLTNMALGYILLFGLSFFLLFLLSPAFALKNPESPQLITLIPLSFFILYFSIYSAGQKVMIVDHNFYKEEGNKDDKYK